MSASIKRLGSTLFTVLFGLALAVNFTLADYLHVLASPALAPTQLGYATRGLWQTVTRGGKVYEVYAIRDAAQNIVGVAAYEANTNGTVRVTDPQLEQRLLLDAETLSVSSTSIELPDSVFGGSNPPSYQDIWGEAYSLPSGETIYVPRFYRYADNPAINLDFVQSYIFGPGSSSMTSVGPGSGPRGLANFDHRVDLYADLLMASILQNVFGPQTVEARQQDFTEYLEALGETFSADAEVLGLIDLMKTGTELAIDSVNHLAAKHALIRLFTHSAQKATATPAGTAAGVGLNAIAVALASIDFRIQWGLNDFRAALEYHRALPDAEQRLMDLKQVLCGGAICGDTPAELNDAVAMGLKRAEERFERLTRGERNPWVEKLKDPAVAGKGVKFVGAVVGLAVSLAFAFGVIKLPISFAATAAIFVVQYVFAASIEHQEGLDNLRRVALAFTLHKRLLAQLPSFNGDRRRALSILNIAYFNLHYYFSMILQRAQDENKSYWWFEVDDNRCQSQNVCDRYRVRSQADAALKLATRHYLRTQFGHYIDPAGRITLNNKRLSLNAPNPNQISVALSPITTTQVFETRT